MVKERAIGLAFRLINEFFLIVRILEVVLRIVV